MQPLLPPFPSSATWLPAVGAAVVGGAAAAVVGGAVVAGAVVAGAVVAGAVVAGSVVLDGPVVLGALVVVVRSEFRTLPGNDAGLAKSPTSIPSVIASMYLCHIVAGNVPPK